MSHASPEIYRITQIQIMTEAVARSCKILADSTTGFQQQHIMQLYAEIKRIESELKEVHNGLYQ